VETTGPRFKQPNISGATARHHVHTRSENSAESFKEEEKATFLQTGTLREGDARYSIDWVEDSDKVFNFSGVRVTPAPVTYQVTLRVSGSQSLVAVNYAVSGNGANNPAEQFLTMPVWDSSFPQLPVPSSKSRLHRSTRRRCAARTTPGHSADSGQRQSRAGENIAGRRRRDIT
jgi:hypothetical protein